MCVHVILIFAVAHAVGSVKHYVSVYSIEPIVVRDSQGSSRGMEVKSTAEGDAKQFRDNHGTGYKDTQLFDNIPRIQSNLRPINDRRLIHNLKNFNNMGSINNMVRFNDRGPLNNMGTLNNMVPINNVVRINNKGPINNMGPISNMGPMNNMGNNNQGLNVNRAIHREVNYLEDERRFQTEFQSNGYVKTVNHASVNFQPSNLRPEYDVKGNSNQGVYQHPNNPPGLILKVTYNQAKGNEFNLSPHPGHVSRNPNIAPTMKIQPLMDNGRHDSGVVHKNIREFSRFPDSAHANKVPQSQIHSVKPTSHSTKINNEPIVSRPYSVSGGMSSAPQNEYPQGHYVPAPFSVVQIPGKQAYSRQQFTNPQMIPDHRIAGQSQEIYSRPQMSGQMVGGNRNGFGHFSSAMDPQSGVMNVGADSVVKFTFMGPKKLRSSIRRLKRSIQTGGNDSEVKCTHVGSEKQGYVICLSPAIQTGDNDTEVEVMNPKKHTSIKHQKRTIQSGGNDREVEVTSMVPKKHSSITRMKRTTQTGELGIKLEVTFMEPKKQTSTRRLERIMQTGDYTAVVTSMVPEKHTSIRRLKRSIQTGGNDTEVEVTSMVPEKHLSIRRLKRSIQTGGNDTEDDVTSMDPKKHSSITRLKRTTQTEGLGIKLEVTFMDPKKQPSTRRLKRSIQTGGNDTEVEVTSMDLKNQTSIRRVKRTIQAGGNSTGTDLIWKLLLSGLSQGSQKPANGNGSGSTGISTGLFGNGGSSIFGHLLGGQNGLLSGLNRPGSGSSGLLNLGGNPNPIYSLLAQSAGGLPGLSILRNSTLFQGLSGQGLLG